MLKEDLRSALSNAVTATEPPVSSGSAEVFSRARKIQRRQRLLAGACVMTAVAGITVAVVTFMPGGDPARQPLAAASATPTPSQSPAERRLALITSVLPTGTQVVDPSEDLVADPVRIRGGLTVADASGTTAVAYSVLHGLGVAPSIQMPTDCPPQENSGTLSCLSETLADGSILISVEEHFNSGSSNALLVRSVTLYGPSGTLVSLGAHNFERVKDPSSSATRPEPILTRAQLRAIVLNPAWLS